MPSNSHDSCVNVTLNHASSSSGPGPNRKDVVPMLIQSVGKKQKMKSLTDKPPRRPPSRNNTLGATSNYSLYSWSKGKKNSTRTTQRTSDAAASMRLGHERDSPKDAIISVCRKKRPKIAMLLLGLTLVVCSWYLIHESFERHTDFLTAQKHLEEAADEQIWRRNQSETNTSFLAKPGTPPSPSRLSSSKNVSLISSLRKPAASGTSRNKKTKIVRQNSTASPKFAYAWLLGGVPSSMSGTAYSNEKSPPNSNTAHLGLIYNILVSVKILKDSGSKADFIVMVHMAPSSSSPAHHAELPANQVKWFTDLGVKIKYVPLSYSYVNEQSTIVLEKFRVLEWIEYDRVLYLSPDTMPYCNLDYIMDLSYGDNAELQPNFLLSIGSTPASGDFFMLQPFPGAFSKFIHILTKRSKNFDDFDAGEGFGVNLKAHNHSWRALSYGLQHQRDLWNFPGADSDQGLLLHYTRYVHGNVSIAIGPGVEHYLLGQQFYAHGNNTLLDRFSCLPQGADSTYGNQRYPSEAVRMHVSPRHTAPYRDFAQWRFNGHKPWHFPRAPPEIKSYDLVNNAHQFWFHVLRTLDSQLRLGLQFTKEDEEAVDLEEQLNSSERYIESDRPNWNHVPIRKLKSFNPAWSTRIQSLTEWALRIENPSEKLTFPWEPPTVLLKERPSSPIDDLRRKCFCPSTLSTDPCSSREESLDDWLTRRVKYYLSKQRPLCPNSTRSKIHVVLPFYNLTKESLKSSVCSVACQDYLEMSIIMYQDGSDDNDGSDALGWICRGTPESIIEFTPTDCSSGRDNDAFDKTAQAAAAAAVQRIKNNSAPTSDHDSPSKLLCVRSNRLMGETGTKYWALKFVHEYANANDVVMVVNGGDELTTPRALQIINEMYINKGVWATFGTHLEHDSDKATPLNDTGYFHTFKAHLLQHETVRDFVDKNKAWLHTAGDRGFVYRLLEIAGTERIGYMSQPLYRLNRSERVVDEAELEYLQTLGESQRLDPPLHVVLVCSNNSTSYLADQLTWLQDQTFAHRRHIHLHLVNSNKDNHKDIESIVNSCVQGQKKGIIGAAFPIKITTTLCSEKYGESVKYRYVHELRQTEPLDSVILLDDIHYWPPEFLDSLEKHYKQRRIVTWKGYSFSKSSRNKTTGRASAWAISGEWTDPVTQRNETETMNVTVATSTGAIFDTNLWLSKQFLRLFNDAHVQSDGLWISYVLDALLGWEMMQVEGPFPVLSSAEWGNEHVLKALFRLLPERHSKRLLELIENENSEGNGLNYSIRRTANVESINEKANAVFDTLQKDFHWNVFRRDALPVRHVVQPEVEVPSVSWISPDKSSTSNGTEKRAFVCVTGQFDRLELTNKIDTIFKPLQKEGYAIDAALVVSGGKARFTNQEKMNTEDFVPFYVNFSDAIFDLESHNIRVLSFNGTYSRLENPPVNEKYFALLQSKQGRYRSSEVQIQRVQNHARIFESYTRCLDYADRAAVAAGFRNSSKYYNVFIRIREDSGLSKPLDQMGSGSKVMSDAIPPPPNSVTVTECRNWFGMNDRMAIVSPDIAHLYFTRPYSVLSNDLFFDERVVRNPESFLLNVYTAANINVLGHPDLKVVVRMVKKENGEVVYYEKETAVCPAPFAHLKRNYELYGWAL